MTYNFNPHRHVKIWLSTNEDSFLNYENQLRLGAMRTKNPDDEINLVYSQSLLLDKSHNELFAYCDKHNITPISIEIDIIPNCKTDQELSLAELYNNEIKNLKNGGGNPAAASDILRWISPVYNLGTYTDFDVEVDTKEIPAMIEIKSPLLLNLGSVSIPGAANILSFNNDVISIVDGIAAKEQIEKVQQSILDAYTGNHNFSYNAYVDSCITELENILPNRLVKFIASIMDSFCKAAKELDNMQVEGMPWQTPYNLRHQLKNEKENQPLIFSQRALRALGLKDDGLTQENYPEVAAKRYRDYLYNKTSWSNWLFLPSGQYTSLKKLLSMDDNLLFDSFSKEVYTTLYMQTVIGSTGPTVMMMSLFGKALYQTKEILEDIAPSSDNFFKTFNKI